MEAYVRTPQGAVTALPVLLEWNIVHSVENCDAFEVRMPLTEGLAETLAGAAEFHCTHLGQTVFRGVVDEYELRAEALSAVAVLSGRATGPISWTARPRAPSTGPRHGAHSGPACLPLAHQRRALPEHDRRRALPRPGRREPLAGAEKFLLLRRRRHPPLRPAGHAAFKTARRGRR
jgi:hypothetical protein